MTGNAVGLERELAKFNEILPTLADQEGKYALIANDKLLGTFDTYSDALDEGYREVGLNPFLVKKVSTFEVIGYFTRDYSLCRISPVA